MFNIGKGFFNIRNLISIAGVASIITEILKLESNFLIWEFISNNSISNMVPFSNISNSLSGIEIHFWY